MRMRPDPISNSGDKSSKYCKSYFNSEIRTQNCQVQSRREVPVARKRVPPPPFQPKSHPLIFEDFPLSLTHEEEETKELQDSPKITRKLIPEATKQIGKCISDAGMITCTLCESKVVEKLLLCRFCSYNACETCWDRWIPTNKSCPNCRKSITSDDLTKNRIAIELERIVKENIPQNNMLEGVYYCSHDSQPAVIYCQNCDEHLCVGCLSTGLHSGHHLVDKDHCEKKKLIYQQNQEMQLLIENTLETAKKIKKEYSKYYDNSVSSLAKVQEEVTQLVQNSISVAFLEATRNIENAYIQRCSQIDQEISDLDEALSSISSTCSIEVTPENYSDTNSLNKNLKNALQKSKFRDILRYSSSLPSRYLFEMYDKTNRLKNELQLGEGTIGIAREALIKQFDEYALNRVSRS
ncbi:unnamed protein product [Moneuplotes crassus]|uniref:Uncharacterized protein n=1 Tax=Euplotes crassus TaxID=5936 RepID=A0AAD1UDI0_EUPCR|nr:unnamed protein product [Moneuplotes crassus]